MSVVQKALNIKRIVQFAKTNRIPLVGGWGTWDTVGGGMLTLKYKDGETKISVPSDVPIVKYEVGDRTDLRPGAPVFIVAVKQPDGTLEGRAWRVGRNGAAPAF